ncbi:MAG: hypothetical protein RI897_4013 [Verrucomicrobiota bacterium]
MEGGGDGCCAVGVDEAGHHGSGAEQLGVTEVLPVVFGEEAVGDVVEIDRGGIGAGEGLLVADIVAGDAAEA